MTPPECPAPPKNHRELCRRQTVVFEEMQFVLNKEEKLVAFTDDQMLILHKIKKAIS